MQGEWQFVVETRLFSSKWFYRVTRHLKPAYMDVPLLDSTKKFYDRCWLILPRTVLRGRHGLRFRRSTRCWLTVHTILGLCFLLCRSVIC